MKNKKHDWENLKKELNEWVDDEEEMESFGKWVLDESNWNETGEEQDMREQTEKNKKIKKLYEELLKELSKPSLGENFHICHQKVFESLLLFKSYIGCACDKVTDGK